MINNKAQEYASLLNEMDHWLAQLVDKLEEEKESSNDWDKRIRIEDYQTAFITALYKLHQLLEGTDIEN